MLLKVNANAITHPIVKQWGDDKSFDGCLPARQWPILWFVDDTYVLSDAPAKVAHSYDRCS